MNSSDSPRSASGAGAGISSATTITTTPSSSVMKTCRHCNADVPGPDLFEHELRCDKMLKQCPHCLRRQKLADLQEHIENCDCRLVPCPNNCGGKFLQRGIPKHLATRCPNKSSSSASVSSPATLTGASAPTMLTPSTSTGSIAPSSTQKPEGPPLTASAPPAAALLQVASAASSSTSNKTECKFCDEEFSTSAIEAHEDACDWKPKRCQHCNMVIISRDLARHEASCKTSQKNCVHCNESVRRPLIWLRSMPHAALGAHTARCSKRPIKCIRCCQQFPADSIVAHSTNCKFVPSSASAASSSATASPQPAARLTTPSAGVLAPSPALGNKIPPPPPRLAHLQLGVCGPSWLLSVDSDNALADRMARRNSALSQLTNPLTTPSSSSLAGFAAAPPASRSYGNASHTSSVPEQDDDGDEEDDDDDEGQLTLAQVVAEWNVENVCLWLHEDVGVPEVVPRFQQRRCDGEMLLDLTESDLINDFGVKNRIHRERILNAIEAIKTSDEFSDEEEEEDEDDQEEVDDEEDDDEEEDNTDDTISVASQRHARSSMGEVPFLHPRDLLRRSSLPSPERGGPATSLPSSSAMGLIT
uniref:SAM domain-containing protein n=1 Tax=Globisporangium ultimum (strain ATCC 200006 / CBS 805.95 / DAOM BR144) TaxID=431595 RepID=K3X265_GLOUD